MQSLMEEPLENKEKQIGIFKYTGKNGIKMIQMQEDHFNALLSDIAQRGISAGKVMNNVQTSS